MNANEVCPGMLADNAFADVSCPDADPNATLFEYWLWFLYQNDMYASCCTEGKVTFYYCMEKSKCSTDFSRMRDSKLRIIYAWYDSKRNLFGCGLSIQAYTVPIQDKVK